MRDKPKVSIIIPVMRPEKAKRCIAAIVNNIDMPQREYEIIVEEDKKGRGCPKMVKRLANKTKADIVCFLGDDTIPQKGFMTNALKAMAALPDGWGMVSFNDNPNTSLSAAHWLCHKKLLPHLDGEFFHTGYTHCFCDNELMIRCQQIGRYIYAYDAFVYHDHPSVHKDAETDEVYGKVYDEKVYERDHTLFQKRMANNWKDPDPVEKSKEPLKICVTLPSNDMIYADTAMCLTRLCAQESMKGRRLFIINPKMSIIKLARNEIVENGKSLEADYIFCIDSDMIFPADTISRFMAHDKEFVCGDYVRRRPPFTTVVTGVDGKPINHNAEDLPALLEIKGGAMGVALIKMSVFSNMEQPYFDDPYRGDMTFLGEDYYLSNKLRQAGVKLYCDTELSKTVGHIGCTAFNISMLKK
jgi:hypothetical protein